MVRQRAQPGSGSRQSVGQSRATTKTPTTPSQQMLALAPLLQLQHQKPNDEELERFREQVASDQQACEAEIQTRLEQAEDAALRRQTELIEIILASLSPPHKRPSSKSSAAEKQRYYPNTRIASNAIYHSIQDVLSSSNNLINEYLRLDGVIAEIRDKNEKPDAESWQNGVDETEQKLRMGARVAVRRVKKVLGAVEDEEGEDGVEQGGNGDENLNMELQRSLSYAERGVRRMVKALPEE